MRFSLFRISILVAGCFLYYLVFVGGTKFDVRGNALDRGKLFIGWSHNCNLDVQIADGSQEASYVGLLKNIGAAMKEKNKGLGETIETLVEIEKQRGDEGKRLLAPLPMTVAQRIEAHRRDRFLENPSPDKETHFESAGRSLGEMSLGDRRDVLLAQLDALLLARVRRDIPLEVLDQQNGDFRLRTGLSFDGPFLNEEIGENSGGKVTSLQDWQERSALKNCPQYGDVTRFNAKMHLKSSFLAYMQQDVVTVPCGVTGEEIASLARALPCVEFSHINVLRRGMMATGRDSFPTVDSVPPCEGCFTPNDLTAEQWHLHGGLAYGIKAQQAWTKHTGYRDKIVIAVVDTGGSWHRDLKPNLYTNEWEAGEKCSDGIDNDNNGFIDDCHGWSFSDDNNNPFDEADKVHGTMVAGVLAARGNNGYGVLGACPYCQIVLLKVARPDGAIEVASLLKAHNYIAQEKFPISVHSYGAYGAVAAEEAAICELDLLGHVFVTAAGNNGCNLESSACAITIDDQEFQLDPSEYPFSPCSYDVGNIVCVGASSASGQMASFSNYGVSTLAFFAPGHEIYTTYNPRTGSEFVETSGTSFSAPIVAAAAAMKKGHNPDADLDEIIRALKATATPTVSLQGRSQVAGIVNLQALIDEVPDSSGLPADTSFPESTPDANHDSPDYFSDAFIICLNFFYIFAVIASLVW